jgi:hypothetical protein
MKNYNVEDWLVEFDIPPAAANPDSPMGPPTGNPDFADTMGDQPTLDPNNPNPNPNMDIQNQEMPEDPNQDQSQNQSDQGDIEEPQVPDMPEESKSKTDDFELWKSNYFKETVKGNANDLLDMISSVRDKENLEPYQRKFIEDNYNIQLIRLNSNILDASKSIRKNIKEQLDKNNPATSIVNHIANVLDTMPHLNNTFIKMMGYSGNKGELHRKFIAALTGSVQVSSSPDKENIIFNEKEYSIKMPTRLNSEWGDVTIGSWSLREDDPERYLSEPELKRLSDGSPEERAVLRRRVVIESIAKQFEEQAFIINIVMDDGTIHYLGWDISNALRGAYSEGKIVIKSNPSENSEAMINDDGSIISLLDLKIYFVRQTGEQDENGPINEEVEFMAKRNGMLFLTAGLPVIKDASSAMQGTMFKEVPYQGNPSDLKSIRRCVYSAHDMLMRQC